MFVVSGKIKDDIGRIEWRTIGCRKSRKSAYRFAKDESLKRHWIETDVKLEDDGGVREHCFYRNGKKYDMGL